MIDPAPLLESEMSSLLQNNDRTHNDADDSDQCPPVVSEDRSVMMLPSLRWALALLYGLQGVSLQLPILALLAVVNDKVAVAPAYLSAYGAICFLPSSLKPIWATLSMVGMSIDAKPCDKIRRSERLLVLMLLANGFAFCGTALLIPVHAIVECFVWGFLRGVTSAWANFLTDQLLILQAKSMSNYEKRGSSYPSISSYFQSKAATYRKAGSLFSSIGTFGLFLQRQIHRDSNDKEPALNAAIVVTLLVGSAAASVLGAFVMITCPFEGREGDLQTVEDRQDSQASIVPDGTQGRASQYHPVPNTERMQDHTPTSALESPVSPSIDDEVESQDDSSRTIRKQWIRKKSDIFTLGLLQVLLIGGAARGPVSSLDHGLEVWTLIMIILSVFFVVAATISTVTAIQIKNNRSSPIFQQPEEGTVIPPRSLGIYLILRYSVPIASFVMYSYVYDIFGDEEPLFLQTLFILETAVAFFSSWVYAQFFSDRFHSGLAMIALLATFTAITSLVSLLDILMVRTRNGSDTIDANLRWMVLSITLIKYFMGNINHLPAVVLATANVVSPSESKRDSSKEESGHDEGIQYAAFMSCINFGAQLGDWISVPIIAGFGITRESKWASLDKFIVLCAVLRMTSILALYIILPPKTKIIAAPSHPEVI